MAGGADKESAVLFFLFLVVAMSGSYADTDSKGRSWEEIAGARQDAVSSSFPFPKVAAILRYLGRRTFGESSNFIAFEPTDEFVNGSQ